MLYSAPVLLPLQCVRGDRYPADRDVPLRLAERRPDPGRRGRRDRQGPSAAPTPLLLQLPVQRALCEYDCVNESITGIKVLSPAWGLISVLRMSWGSVI